eukprot:Protomagalhaensia_wolfi_Nauph_80__1074@NODE_1626_length_1434_cov_11_874552_g1260_i0_p1_GENE_NODE_1626_length_1434_cov_11_874552_g1260_i0NODE_1626_length_1434_cov_11_874552_g1260_i0_p1_ORF_typecomplete_len428_score82_30_NODE_1626_length_1434_cov_11_874552_g1260_i01501391
MTHHVVGKVPSSTACGGLKRNVALTLLASVPQGGLSERVPLGGLGDREFSVILRACISGGTLTQGQEALYEILDSTLKRSRSASYRVCFDIRDVSLSDIVCERKEQVDRFALPGSPVQEAFWMPDVTPEQVGALSTEQVVFMRASMPDFNVAEYLDYQDIVDVLPPKSYLVVYQATSRDACIHTATKSNMKGVKYEAGAFEWIEYETLPARLIVLVEHSNKRFTPMLRVDQVAYQGVAGGSNRYGPESLAEAIVDVHRYENYDFGEASRVAHVNRMRLALAKKVSEKLSPQPSVLQNWRQELAGFLGKHRGARKSKLDKLKGFVTFNITRPGYEPRRFEGITLDELKFSIEPPVLQKDHAVAVKHFENLNKILENRRKAEAQADVSAVTRYQKQFCEVRKQYAAGWIKYFHRT